MSCAVQAAGVLTSLSRSVAACRRRRPINELQLHLAAGGALEAEWAAWLDVPAGTRIIRCSAAVSLVPRKAAKLHYFMTTLNTTGRATQMAPGILDLPNVTLVVLPEEGVFEQIMQARPSPGEPRPCTPSALYLSCCKPVLPSGSVRSSEAGLSAPLGQ